MWDIRKIHNRLKDVWDKLEYRYGNIGYVVDNYSDLQNDRKFTDAFPFSEEFFVALRNLRTSGAPQITESNLFSETIYYLVNQR